jgi:hypothetical protein
MRRGRRSNRRSRVEFMLEETNFFSALLESAITNCSSCTKLCNCVAHLKGKKKMQSH